MGVGAASQRLIPSGERSGLMTRTAMTRFVVRADANLTAFLELEAAIQARCCEYRLLANNHNVEAAPHHGKIEIILELHGH
jgi:hypothetical protein